MALIHAQGWKPQALIALLYWELKIQYMAFGAPSNYDTLVQNMPGIS